MKASEIIKGLQERIECYGDWDVIIRVPECGDDDDLDVGAVYADDEAERFVISDFPGIY